MSSHITKSPKPFGIASYFPYMGSGNLKGVKWTHFVNRYFNDLSPMLQSLNDLKKQYPNFKHIPFLNNEHPYKMFGYFLK